MALRRVDAEAVAAAGALLQRLRPHVDHLGAQRHGLGVQRSGWWRGRGRQVHAEQRGAPALARGEP